MWRKRPNGRPRLRDISGPRERSSLIALSVDESFLDEYVDGRNQNLTKHPVVEINKFYQAARFCGGMAVAGGPAAASHECRSYVRSRKFWARGRDAAPSVGRSERGDPRESVLQFVKLSRAPCDPFH
jgi:hypothetical protein